MSGNTGDELLTELYDKTLTGNGPAVLDLTRAGLSQGLGPATPADGQTATLEAVPTVRTATARSGPHRTSEGRSRRSCLRLCCRK